MIEAQIASILDEIGFKMSLNVIRFLGVVLTKIVLRTCTAIYVNEPKLLKVSLLHLRHISTVLIVDFVDKRWYG